MKEITKIIIVSVALTVSFAVNAATVTWQLTSIADSPNSVASAGWIAYVLDASTYTAFTGLDAGSQAKYAAENAFASGLTTNARYGKNATIEEGDYAKDETKGAYIVIFDASSIDTASYMAYTSAKTATIPASGSDVTVSFGTFSNATQNGGWQSIPEPTSGLLMLLGAAGLALKRKRV